MIPTGFIVIGAMLILSVTPITTYQAPTAQEQLRELQTALHNAHVKNDWPAYLSNSRKLKDFENGAPESLLQLMSAEAFSNDLDGALLSFKDFVQMGQSDEEVLKLNQFDALRADPRFTTTHTEMVENTTSQSIASKAFTLNDSDLLPEDIDYDSTTGRFYVTSVLKKQILSVDASGKCRLFVKAPDSWPMLALKVDQKHHILWATEVALDGFATVAQKDWGRSAILIYSMPEGKLLHRLEGPSHSALGDMTLDVRGDAIISDGGGGGVYRVRRDAQRIERLDAGDFISPQTSAMAPDGERVFVPDYMRGIGLLDMKSKQVSWIAMENRYALNGIDGLYFYAGTLLATQNGTSPERVIAFKLDSSLSRVASETIIERATPTLGDPTHGVVVGNTFYYIANSGWNALDDHGNKKAGAVFSPPLIMRVPLDANELSPKIQRLARLNHRLQP